MNKKGWKCNGNLICLFGSTKFMEICETIIQIKFCDKKIHHTNCYYTTANTHIATTILKDIYYYTSGLADFITKMASINYKSSNTDTIEHDCNFLNDNFRNLSTST